jgi:2-polyprenyl-3-methyl-5-hydroxy-6-metoxy-1,4-benzoquinol methylase
VRNAPPRSSPLALEDRFAEVLADVARAHGLPALTETKRIAPLLEKLSEAYNTGEAQRAKDLLAARLAFSFPRDVPKADAAVRELCAASALRAPEGRALRVLDLGAGLGAMTMGIARAVARVNGGPVDIDASWVDGDAAAMELGRAIVSRAKGADERNAHIAVRAERDDVVKGLARQKGPFDVIVCGQVLSEMHRDEVADARVAAHAAFLADVAKKLAPDGSLVVIEPALRERARHLHAVRDALVAAQPELGVFAPCLHRAACPMLATQGDWCHEDLPVDLPEFLVPLAKAAGLRWQGLTFSYLVLRRDGLTLRAASDAPLRITSSRIVTKGKVETFVCGELGGVTGAKKLVRLDRDESEANAAFGELTRGDLVRLDPEPGPNGRLGAQTHVKYTRH